MLKQEMKDRSSPERFLPHLSNRGVIGSRYEKNDFSRDLRAESRIIGPHWQKNTVLAPTPGHRG